MKGKVQEFFSQEFDFDLFLVQRVAALLSRARVDAPAMSHFPTTPSEHQGLPSRRPTHPRHVARMDAPADT